MLRPSLLDNIGLVAALSWRLMAMSKVHSVKFTTGSESLEPSFEAAAGLHLYRVCEAWLQLCLSSGDLSGVELSFAQNEVNELQISVQVIGVVPTLSGLATLQLSARADVAGARVAITQQADGATLVINKSL